MGLLVPMGAVFLAMLVGYGLMEFVGVLWQRVTRPVWRVPCPPAPGGHGRIHRSGVHH